MEQAPDYLAIGHVCKDLTPAGPRLGGTVTFSALTAQALGLRAAVLTSTSADMQDLLQPLQTVSVVNIRAEHPTTFENIYAPEGRHQRLLGRGAPLLPSYVPPAWRSASIVHLAPVANEVAPSLAEFFSGSFIGVTPQGWMRHWDKEGLVSFRPWQEADRVLSYAKAVVLSIEDVGGDQGLVRGYASKAQVLVMTLGAQGSLLFIQGKEYAVPAPPVIEQDPTGAGDIFATAFFVRLSATGDPFEAARFATLLASASVEYIGLDSIPSADTIQSALFQP
jgi:sugar/nucleoside kinase (ribokinase family)